MLGVCSQARAFSTRDYAIETTAAVQTSPPQITLNWRNNGDGLPYYVQRRAKDAPLWDDPVVLPSDATSYVDSSVSSDMIYEYGITQGLPPSTAVSGYIMVGINAPVVDFRGRIILIVDSTVAPSLENELGQLQQDLVGDGWLVVRHDVSRDSGPPDVKALIQAEYQADSANTRAVFLVGHVPVPYSGDINPDDHSNHKGAWVADTYYGDMDGQWMDATVFDTGAARASNRNVPGDGKFDQSTIPADLKLEVGRVDFNDMPSFSPLSEVDLLRAYLNKDHQYRIGAILEPRRGLIFDGFGESGGLAYAASGWRNFAPLFSSENIAEVGSGGFLPAVQADGYLWSYAGGGGDQNYVDCYGVGQTSDFVNMQIRTIFLMFFGSYFGDWDNTDCIFRAALASGECLGVTWVGIPHWFFHPMAVGETIGYCTQITQNNADSYVPNNFARSVHISLLGDPALRLHVVAPPSSLQADTSSGSVTLTWQSAADSNAQGYQVYRSGDPNGPFTKLTSSPVSDLSYVDAPAPGSYTYMIRTVKLESTPSGSYFNLSQGAFVTTAVSHATGSIVLTNAHLASGKIVFDCEGQSGQLILIEQSGDLQKWNAISEDVLTDDKFEFSTEVTGSTVMFYRARLLP